MLDVTYGDTKNNNVIAGLVHGLQEMDLTGDLFVGYPILGSVDGRVEVDSLLVTREHGVVAFDLKAANIRSLEDPSAEKIIARQDDIYVSLENKLKSYNSLRRGRNLGFDIKVVSISAEVDGIDELDGRYLSTIDSLPELVASFDGIDADLQKNLNAALQHTATIRPKKRRTQVAQPDSRGSILRKIEAAIANMDAWQKKAAIEFPEGPQRVRGLAGSGKTIVLAQKAAILHAKFPHWKIAVTFQTRSLYQQFRNLIDRFYRELTLDDPDWDHLQVLHAWGSTTSAGLYYEIAKFIGHPIKDFDYAKSKYGYDRAFEGICLELLKDMNNRPIQKKYDAILIDEAQDFPQPFFEVVYNATSEPHRIVWAYDELQNLSDYTMSPSSELFGKKADGSPRVELSNEPGAPQQDIVLPVCYRNTRWALTIAHGLGFGIYRDRGLVQFFDAPKLWEDIGYRFMKGQPRGGSDVVIERKKSATPEYFENLIEANDAVTVERFPDADKQYRSVAEKIYRNVTHDEIDADDILVVFCSPRSIRADAAGLMAALAKFKINSHLVGVTSSRDEVFKDNSVALTGIYRAKGNEAPMVYVLNAEYCVQGIELSKRRNILFTAMTRSRAWVRVTGVGPAMDGVVKEAVRVVENEYRLSFKYPTKDEIAKIKRLHRDMPADEKQALENDLEGLARVLRRIETGDLDPSNLPRSVQNAIKKMAPSR